MRSARLWLTCLGLMACGGGGGGGGNGTPDGAAGGEVADQGVDPDGASGGTAGGAAPSDASPGGDVVPDGTTGGATGGQPGPDAGPDAPSCEATCTLLEECGASLPTECVAACAALEPAERAAFGRCGDRLDAGECATDAFFECVAADAYPACGRACDANATCGLTLDAACGRACLSAVLSEDPLESLRVSQRDACLEAAGDDCAAAARCAVNGDPVTPDLAAWCAAYQGCGFDDAFGFPCGDAYDLLANARETNGLACAWEALGSGVCPPDPFSVIDRCLRTDAPPSLAACTRTCEALVACDPASAPGESSQACAADCASDAPSDAAARVRALVPCNSEATCDAFAACEAEQGPAAQCAQLCGRRAACLPGEDAAECDAECVANFGQVRTQRALACGRDTQDCESLTACLPPPAPPCDEYCAGLEACGFAFGDRPTCVRDCAQQSVDSLGSTDGRVACVLAAGEACGDAADGVSVIACLQSNWAPAQGCLLACRARTVCAGDPAQLWACTQACSDGSAGPEAQANARSVEACVAAVEPFGPATCDLLTRCAPELGALDCDGYCAQVEACGVAPPDCAEACARDPLARSRAASEADCLASARGDCDAVRVCRRYAPLSARVYDRAAVCAQWSACGLDAVFTCDDALNLGGGPNVLACVGDLISTGCPADPFDVFNACFGRAQIDPVCLADCSARGVCGLEGGGDACVSTCIERLNQPEGALEDAVRLAAQLACLDEGVCADLSACIASSTPAALCDAHCAALEACGVVDAVDAAACRSVCDADFARARTQAERACVTAAEGVCDAVRDCLSTPPACAAACDRLAGCGFESVPFDCVAACDDAAFAAGERGARLTTCVLTSPRCGAEAEACLGGSTEPAELCARFCDAQGGCVGSASEWTACMNACGAPLESDTALQLAAARECLLEAEADDCAAQVACIPEAADPPSVAAVCAIVSACGVPAADCEAALAGDAGRDAAACLVEADRLSAGCVAVAACIGYVAPPPAPGCDTLCARRSACDPSVDAFLCAQACSSEPAAAPVRAACAEVSRCDAVEACAALDAGTAPLCVAPCADAVACGAFESAAACGALCTGRLRSPSAPADYLVQLGACIDALPAAPACDAVQARACFDYPLPGEGCEGACQILIDCGALPGQTAEECAGECANASMLDPAVNQRVIQCIVDFAGRGVCDLESAQACANAVAGGGGGPEPVPPPAPR